MTSASNHWKGGCRGRRGFVKAALRATVRKVLGQKGLNSKNPDSPKRVGANADRQGQTAAAFFFLLLTSLRTARARISQALTVTVAVAPPTTEMSRSYWLLRSSPSTRTW